MAEEQKCIHGFPLPHRCRLDKRAALALEREMIQKKIEAASERLMDRLADELWEKVRNWDA